LESSQPWLFRNAVKIRIGYTLKTILFTTLKEHQNKWWELTDIVTLYKCTLAGGEFNEESKYAELVIKGVGMKNIEILK
jgi:hypothetical protein